MKMEHEIAADVDGVVRSVEVAVGDTVDEGQLLAVLGPGERASGSRAQSDTSAGAGGPRDDLDAVRARHAQTLDAARPEAVAKRHEQGRRTARENLADLVDPGSFVEYGPLMFAAQERRRQRRGADRTHAGGRAGRRHGDDRRRCRRSSCPTTTPCSPAPRGCATTRRRTGCSSSPSAGGCRSCCSPRAAAAGPATSTGRIVAGLDCRAFHLFARLSGLVPLVGIASGYCFAGNAALLGCCDVVIATEDSSIGMGGPAMIEGGGLGVYDPQEVGPIDVQDANGVVDLRVADEAAAVAAAKRYLSYFNAHAREPEARARDQTQRAPRPDPRQPQARSTTSARSIDALLDDVLELRRGFGAGIVTALARATTAGRSA